MSNSNKQDKPSETERQRRVIVGQELANLEQIRESLAKASENYAKRNRRVGD